MSYNAEADSTPALPVWTFKITGLQGQVYSASRPAITDPTQGTNQAIIQTINPYIDVSTIPAGS